MKRVFTKKSVLSFLMMLCCVAGITLFQSVNANAATAVPANVKQTDASASAVKVSWDAVPDTLTLYYRLSTTSGTVISSSRTSGTYDYLYGLSGGTTYYYQIGTSTTYSSTVPSDVTWATAIKVVTAPSYSYNSSSISYTAATSTSVSLSWSAASGATGYKIEYYPSSASSSTAKAVYVSATKTTLKSLKKNTSYTVYITPYRQDGGYLAEASSSSYKSGLKTLPSKVTGVNCDYFSTDTSKGYATFEWDKNAVADGYKYEIYSYSGKKLLSGSTSNYGWLSITNSKLKTRQVYKIRIQPFVNLSANKKAAGSWSSYEYFMRSSGTDVNFKNSGGKIKASWSTVKGATGYTVYMATKYNGKYTKYGSTTKTSYTINKQVSTGKSYYVRVVPYCKKSSTTYKATVNSSYFYSDSVYISKYGWY